MAFNQGCRGLTALRPLDIRYYRYVVPSLSERLRAAGQGSTFVELSTDALASTPLPLPPVKAQRVIADFLDAETARIDALITKKRQLKAVLVERRNGRMEQAIRRLAVEWGEVPLTYVADQITVGIVVTPAAWYVEVGIPALRGINVKPGRIDVQDMVHISEEGHALHSKSALRAGDVVVVRTGQAGVAAVVPRRFGEANCIDLIVIRPCRKLAPQFLEFVLNSDWTQKHVQEHSVGTIQSHFNVAAMKRLQVPQAPLAEQLAVVSRLAKLNDEIDEVVDRLHRQIALLQEHRQALITAAVTGELDIPGVAA